MSVVKLLARLFNSKKALSNIIASVIMILLVVIAMILVGTFVTNLIQDRITESGSCLDTLDQVLIKDSQTCYSPSLNELKVFIEVKDIEINEILISVADESTAIPFTIKSEPSTIPSVENYSRGNLVSIPPKKSGLAYYFNLTELELSKPTSVKVVPIINGKSCSETDQITSIPLCA